MYRQLIPLLLCTSSVLAAPQQNSNITYVKRQLQLEYTQPDVKSLERESRIEKVPLTIPGNVDKKEPDDTNGKSAENVKIAQKDNSQPTYNYSDRIYSIKTKPKKNNYTERNVPKEEDKKSVNKTDTNVSENKDSDIVPAESINNDRVVADDGLSFEADATQSNEFVTEKYDDEVTLTTEIEAETTEAPTPRLAPKLSYFEKPTFGSFSQNLIAPAGKRRFRSRCRCEKIWNCAKLQISVPRCPEEYFMCCS